MGYQYTEQGFIARRIGIDREDEKMGYPVPEPTDPHPERKQTYHYLPYRFDSGLEREFFKDSVLPILGEYKSQLEIYFNGDDTLTDFKIDCYKQSGREWRYIGKYVPDFLLLKRNDDGSIHQIIIIETKGEGFAAKFADRRQFMETEFIRKNNECFGYERFRFLYLEDTLTKEEREKKTIKAIKDFSTFKTTIYMAIKYIPYFPNTLEGQAVLDNFVRTKRILRYRDNDRVEERIQQGMPLYETELQERIGGNQDGNLVLRGECLSACAYLKDKGITVDLVYIDPPFASGADYAKKVYLRRNPKVAEAIRQAESELDIEELRSFEEKMYGDIWNKESYLNWMYENLMAIKSIMSDTASIYVHLDWHIGHYVKILLDEVFGEDNFQREIIWDIQVLSGFKTIAPNWVRGHDTIFYYSKNEERIFNKLIQPHKKEYLDSFNKQDENGRWYMVAHGTKRYRDEVEKKENLLVMYGMMLCLSSNNPHLMKKLIMQLKNLKLYSNESSMPAVIKEWL